MKNYIKELQSYRNREIEVFQKLNLEDLNMNFYTQYTEETSSFNTKVNQTSMDNRLNQIYKEQLEE